MNQNQVFRARLRVRLGMALNSDELILIAKVGGREVEVRSVNSDEKLRDAKWIVFGSGGFASEAEAQAFGEQLRSVAGIVGFCLRLGIDVGEDKTTTWVNEEFARSIRLIGPDERLHPNVHGLTIHPDDGRSRFPSTSATLSGAYSPTQLVQAIEGFGIDLPPPLSGAEVGVRLLNRALMTSEPLTQVVLAVSVVEALGQDEKWTEKQRCNLQALAELMETGHHTDQEDKEIADALLRSVHRISLRQGVLRVLTRLKLEHLKKEWDRLYGMRSGVFHGTEHLSETEIRQLAQDCITLCGKIVIALLKEEGIGVPEITANTYPI
jgi:hypothetical protein